MNARQALYHLRPALHIECRVVMCFSKKKLNLFTPNKKDFKVMGEKRWACDSSSSKDVF